MFGTNDKEQTLQNVIPHVACESSLRFATLFFNTQNKFLCSPGVYETVACESDGVFFYRNSSISVAIVKFGAHSKLIKSKLLTSSSPGHRSAGKCFTVVILLVS